jgi:hypothetical protein
VPKPVPDIFLYFPLYKISKAVYNAFIKQRRRCGEILSDVFVFFIFPALLPLEEQKSLGGF